jgi:hypothetical protein
MLARGWRLVAPSRPKVRPGRDRRGATCYKSQQAISADSVEVTSVSALNRLENRPPPICVQCMTRRNAELTLRRFIRNPPTHISSAALDPSISLYHFEIEPHLPRRSPQSSITPAIVLYQLREQTPNSHCDTNTYCLLSQNHQASDAICLIARHPSAVASNHPGSHD